MSEESSFCTVNTEIDAALTSLVLSKSDLRKCSEDEARHIQERAKQTFVRGSPRVWWHSLKIPFKTFIPTDGEQAFERLESYIPNNEICCWFIPETETEVLPVFDATVEAVKKILAECTFFEYYIVGKNFDWLLVENDHCAVIVAKIDQLV